MVDIRLVKQAEEKERLVDLFRLSFGQKMSAELWEWKYLLNPFQEPEPEVVVALEEGNLAGARPFLVAEMWLGDEKVRVAQHCDTMVHPGYRGKGIFNRMGEFAIQYLRENGYALSYGFPNTLSRPGFLRQGYKVVAPTETVFRTVHADKLLSLALGKRLLGRGLGFVYDLLYSGRIKAPRPSGTFQVEVHDTYTDDLCKIDALRDKTVIDLVRSESYLRWRFDQHPEYDYKYVIAKRQGELWGYAVVSKQEKISGLNCGMIVDYLVRNRDSDCFQVIMNQCLVELEKLGSDIILVWTFSEPELMNELLQHWGFKSSFKFPYYKFFGRGYLDAILIDDSIAAKTNIYDKDNWRVTHALHDTE